MFFILVAADCTWNTKLCGGGDGGDNGQTDCQASCLTKSSGCRRSCQMKMGPIKSAVERPSLALPHKQETEQCRRRGGRDRRRAGLGMHAAAAEEPCMSEVSPGKAATLYIIFQGSLLASIKRFPTSTGAGLGISLAASYLKISCCPSLIWIQIKPAINVSATLIKMSDS